MRTENPKQKIQNRKNDEELGTEQNQTMKYGVLVANNPHLLGLLIKMYTNKV